MTRIFQTRQWPAEAEAALDQIGTVERIRPDRPLSVQELRHGLESSDVFCPTVCDRIDGAVLDGLDLRGKLIANYGAGTSHIDVSRAVAAGALISNTPDVLTDCTADIAILLLLAAARRAEEGGRELRSGGWSGWHPMHMLGTSVTGKTLGLIGFGRIARAVAHRAHFGFGMDILVWNRSPVDRDVLSTYGARQMETLELLLGNSDFVSLHVPGGEGTYHLINAQRLAQMRQDACIINTARGTVIDEAALVEALQRGTIAGAALDVFEDEPKIHAGLLDCNRATILPHLGSATVETRTKMGMRVVQNIDRWLKQGIVHDPVSPDDT